MKKKIKVYIFHFLYNTFISQYAILKNIFCKQKNNTTQMFTLSKFTAKKLLPTRITSQFISILILLIIYLCLHWLLRLQYDFYKPKNKKIQEYTV